VLLAKFLAIGMGLRLVAYYGISCTVCYFCRALLLPTRACARSLNIYERTQLVIVCDYSLLRIWCCITFVYVTSTAQNNDVKGASPTVSAQGAVYSHVPRSSGRLPMQKTIFATFSDLDAGPRAQGNNSLIVYGLEQPINSGATGGTAGCRGTEKFQACAGMPFGTFEPRHTPPQKLAHRDTRSPPARTKSLSSDVCVFAEVMKGTPPHETYTWTSCRLDDEWTRCRSAVDILKKKTMGKTVSWSELSQVLTFQCFERAVSSPSFSPTPGCSKGKGLDRKTDFFSLSPVEAEGETHDAIGKKLITIPMKTFQVSRDESEQHTPRNSLAGCDFVLQDELAASQTRVAELLLEAQASYSSLQQMKIELNDTKAQVCVLKHEAIAANYEHSPKITSNATTLDLLDSSAESALHELLFVQSVVLEKVEQGLSQLEHLMSCLGSAWNFQTERTSRASTPGDLRLCVCV